MAIYTSPGGVTVLQRKIIKYIMYWVATEKTPVPQAEIIFEMDRRGYKESTKTVSKSLESLVKLGYIRKSGNMTGTANKTFYVLLRTL